MKNRRMNMFSRFVSLVLITAISVQGYTQDGLTKRTNVNINSNCNGLLQYLPVGYSVSPPSQRYPLIISLLGLNSNGTGATDAELDKLWTGGGFPHEQQDPLDPGTPPFWVDAYTVGSNTYRFVIVTPQFIQNMISHIPTAPEVNDVINYAIANYKIDTSRIYLVGASQGGGTTWDYAGYSSAYARRIAAIMPFGGVSFPFQEKANIMKYANVKVWAFHNDFDNSVPSSFTKDYVNYYNNPPVPAVPARKTIFPANGHQCWYLPLTRNYTEGGMNVYEWLLQYQSTPTKAFAGEDQEITVPASSVNLAGLGTAPNNTVSSWNWTKVSGPAGGIISSPNSQNTSVNSLQIGTYIYRVTITGTDASVATDDVAITVNPGAQRIQAESYTAASGPIRPNPFDPGSFDMFRNPTSDDPPPNNYRIDGINQTEWLNYSVTVPAAGTYRFRFRTGTIGGGTQFQVKKLDGTILATVDMYATGPADDVYMNLFANIPLVAGTQTIRIQSSSTGFPGNNWFMNWFEVIDQAVDLAPLPINFTVFNAACENGAVKLVWKTSGEFNSRNFSVEKSANGSDWISLGTVPAAGQSSGEISYSFTDPAPGNNNSYRIVGIDQNGRRTNSSVIRSNCAGRMNFNVFPNPVIDKVVVNISLDAATRLKISLMDSRGATVRVQTEQLSRGNSQVSVNMADLPAGNYTLVAQLGEESKSVKLIKK